MNGGFMWLHKLCPLTGEACPFDGLSFFQFEELGCRGVGSVSEGNCSAGSGRDGRGLCGRRTATRGSFLPWARTHSWYLFILFLASGCDGRTPASTRFRRVGSHGSWPSACPNAGGCVTIGPAVVRRGTKQATHTTAVRVSVLAVAISFLACLCNRLKMKLLREIFWILLIWVCGKTAAAYGG